ncbi:hypothetical protein EJ05DRAFT_504592 [Pseudovirgaria hyperparasitica]|uniref:CST complex subunit Stn1 N-terminal domain-containing protein n=1 Tax=Pseudovirgaria hyperparasitica TaxID=470096 RepID=A0A6A6VVU9_9PEZI|nr:uncharacterized protein EJ05DRAFT_504592 [Pseudovirgaria hyperparasitica]KAF2753989.1 hypothetical protein EJ05DRAFT_504592 [Pseudovirgaria hyperparasitica]
MTTRRSQQAQNNDIYPARYFKASRTYDAWVHLTCSDVHALRAVRGFEGQQLLFHRNHPIRFVRITGPINSITDLSARFTLFTIDDSSGSTLEIKVPRLPAEIADSPECPSNTAIDNLNVHTALGIFDVVVDDIVLDIGTVVSTKGIVCEFRGIRQLDLKRIKVLKTTLEEARLWANMSKFKNDVLNQSWVLTPEERAKLDLRAAAEEEKDRRKQKEWAVYRNKKAERKRLAEEKRREKAEKYERRRLREEEKMNQGALI